MPPPLIELRDVDVELDGHPVLHQVTWSLRRGENWAVLGRNGSGKSTLLKLLRGELWPAPGSPGRRFYALDGERQETAVGVKERIALVSPEQQARYLQQEWTLTGEQVIESGVQGGDYAYQKLTPLERKQVAAVIRLLRIGDLRRRNVQSLSHGELRKVLIARALAGQPAVLICDEVCDGLDARSRAGLLSALEALARAGTQMLFTTHREEELFPALTHRLRLENGWVQEAGPMELKRVPSRRKPRPQPGVTTPRPAGQGRAARPEAEGAGPGANLLASPRAHPRLPPGYPMIQIQHADVFLGPEPALSGINLEISAGQHWAFLGPNGAGKSTLLKLVLGDLHPAWGGRVRRFEFSARNTLWQVKRRIGLVSPELQANYRETLTGFHAIASGFFASVGLVRRLSRSQRERVEEIVKALGLTRLAAAPILHLSYGEFRRILIARALVHGPDLLLCDEPFDGLDGATRQEIASALEAVAAHGTTLVVVTHHREDLPRCITHVAELEAGRIRCQGAVDRRREPAGPGRG